MDHGRKCRRLVNDAAINFGNIEQAVEAEWNDRREKLENCSHSSLTNERDGSVKDTLRMCNDKQHPHTIE